MLLIKYISLLFTPCAGYEGDHCQVDIDECMQNPCENGGECFQRSDVLIYEMLPQFSAMSFSHERAAGFICSCLPGFTGKEKKPALNCPYSVRMKRLIKTSSHRRSVL